MSFLFVLSAIVEYVWCVVQHADIPALWLPVMSVVLVKLLQLERLRSAHVIRDET